MSEWASGFLVKRALREWLGGLVAPLFGSAESVEAAEFMKQHGEHQHALEALQNRTSGVQGFEFPKDVHGVTFNKTDPYGGTASIMSAGSKPGLTRRTTVKMPWEDLPSEARGQFMQGGVDAHSLSGRKSFAEAAARGTDMSQRLKSLGTKTLLGAGGGALGAYLLYKALSKNKEEPAE